MHTKIFRRANDFSNEEVAVFRDVVMKAGEVSAKTFNDLINKNPLLLFLDSTQEPSGVAALKIPFDSYKSKVFRKSGATANLDQYTHELGWVVSKANGNGNALMTTLVKTNIPMYATVREENHVMIHLLTKYGFSKQGSRYLSDRGDYYLLLFTRD